MADKEKLFILAFMPLKPLKVHKTKTETGKIKR